MKKIIAICIIATACFATPACKGKSERVDEKNVISADKVPTVVTSAFDVKYPTASEVVWENAHENEMTTYKVKFKQDGQYMKAEFAEDGNLVKEGKDNS